MQVEDIFIISKEIDINKEKEDKKEEEEVEDDDDEEKEEKLKKEGGFEGVQAMCKPRAHTAAPVCW